jgi:hypothetical protein
MHTNPQMERILPTRLRHILVGANTGGLESLGRQLLVLVRDEVSAEGELVDGGTFTTEIVDADLSFHISKTHFPPIKRTSAHLGVRDTTVIPRLGVWLVLAVAVAASRTTTHLYLMYFWSSVPASSAHNSSPHKKTQKRQNPSPPERHPHPKSQSIPFHPLFPCHLYTNSRSRSSNHQTETKNRQHSPDDYTVGGETGGKPQRQRTLLYGAVGNPF